MKHITGTTTVLTRETSTFHVPFIICDKESTKFEIKNVFSILKTEI